MTITFTVLGKPQPAGSKRAFIWRAKDGRSGASVVDDNPRGKSWQAAVADAAMSTYSGPLLDCPLKVRFHFFTPRPAGHFRKNGEVNPKAPAFPTTRPDVLKLARGCEDALTGIVWRDDSRIVAEELLKSYGEPARVEITIAEMTPEECAAAEPAAVLF